MRQMENMADFVDGEPNDAAEASGVFECPYVGIAETGDRTDGDATDR